MEHAIGWLAIYMGSRMHGSEGQWRAGQLRVPQPGNSGYPSREIPGTPASMLYKYNAIELLIVDCTCNIYTI